MEEGVDRQPTIEHLIGPTEGHHLQQPAFNPDGFRSLEGESAEGQGKRREAEVSFRRALPDNEDFEELYMQLRHAQRLCNELHVAEGLLREKIGRGVDGDE